MYDRYSKRPGSSSRGAGRSYGNSSGGRGSFSSSSRGGGHSRPQRTNSRPSRGRMFGEFSDITKFVNKAVIAETAPIFVPEHKFADFEVDERLKQNIITKGYVLPTPIQDRAIPHVLRGEDVVGIANTGTGKTAAFLIPLINKVLKNPREGVLIMVPTRELAIQIEDELKGFIKGFKIFSVVCVGGASMSAQIRNLRYQNNFIIGTPGRLKDLVEQKYLHLGEFKTVVLDEADRMLDMGFIADMRFMMSKMSKERHTLFFSATMSRDIELLIKDFLKNPVSISVKTGDTAKNVDQDIVRLLGKNKVDVLHNLLSDAEFKKVLVFGRTKHGVEKLSQLLVQKGHRAESIHGNKNLSKRQRALGMFKTSQIRVLVATDVAARGLDISDVSHVINFDLPSTYEDYVHRIGRTGRGNKKGKALTFIE
ncbi:MAG: DNA/RNA helicase [Candidatus Taylorbacteria bacterium CG11_big_fil_rev_8_21_14_0_20_46_11]|uniref:DNA/RNA helicase n=1 Tax=Candidatus Taylorbacteria bacterium CG11_big_fil_rev_8_21_14_0_20_46_11 TaxID=1975025 RepID=A0A2H0KAK7_9BACT|nr:MAG: DNA/RNA helicase [Candidatus Taylorbacteria bacterium CG11_big_fil_rev_8_21_14_0_20_46_11]